MRRVLTCASRRSTRCWRSHPAMRVAHAALTEAQAQAQRSAGSRPSESRRTGRLQANPPARRIPTGVNTAVAGVNVTLPLFDRNEGNRSAADADVRRAQHFAGRRWKWTCAPTTRRARQDYELRRMEVDDAARSRSAVTRRRLPTSRKPPTCRPAPICCGCSTRERARLDAEAAWVQGMVEYQQSVVNLEAAEGLSR